MKNKYLFDDAKNIFESKGYCLITNESEYINASTKLRYICNKHFDEGEQFITLSKVNAGRGCYYCGREKTENSRKRSFESYESESKSMCLDNDFEFVQIKKEEGYVSIVFICNKHRHLGEQSRHIIITRIKK